MKLVVDIPEEHLKTLRQLSGLGYYHEVIAKGQPLSELLDKISAEINTQNRGTCDYFIVDRIEEIINKYREGDSE